MLAKVEFILSKLITALIVLAFFAMVVLAFLQVILRNFFASGITWADVTVRHLVLWVGFFGAVLAASQDRHITLDIFSRALPARVKRYIQSLLYLGGAAVCFALTYASYKFVVSERLMGGVLFAGLPLWLAQTVIPLTFGMIGVVFLLRVVTSAMTNDQ